MRQCSCGGVIRQHQLTGNREAWTCNACGRYEAIERPLPASPPPAPKPAKTGEQP